MILATGKIVAERYRVVSEIASGGMGTVYRVERVRDGLPFAFKVIRKGLAPKATTLERFKREARLLATVAHPGVVQMVDAGLMKDGSAFLVMELLEGETLLDYLRREAPVTAVELAPIVRGIAAALDAVHSKGVVHRDLKPSNAFLTKDGVKLVDFGIAQAMHVTRLTLTGQVVGTVRYMSPEQVMGRDINHRADVYALGVLTWSALAGGPPFLGTGMAAVEEILNGAPRLDKEVPGLGPAVADVVHKAMSQDRDRRFTSAGAFAMAFAKVAAGAPKERPSRSTGFVPIPSTGTGVTGIAQEAPARTFTVPTGSSTSTSVRAARRSAQSKSVAVGVGIAVSAIVAVAALLSIDLAPKDAQTTGAAAEEGPMVVPVPLPPPDAASAVRLIRIESRPSGALVEIDGAILGNTPMDYPAPTDRSRVELQVSVADHEPSAVFLGADTESPVVVTLHRGQRAPPRRAATRPIERPPPAMQATMRPSGVLDIWAN